jgi:drug/metabolite transporter (DMT)-like permease
MTTKSETASSTGCWNCGCLFASNLTKAINPRWRPARLEDGRYGLASVRRSAADLMLLATVSLWALNFTVSKYILDHGFHPLSYSSVRYGIAAVLFAAITLSWEGSLRIGRRELPLIVFGVLVLFANQLSFVYALRFTTATTVALLFGTLPIFTALFATGSRVEELSFRFWLAAGLSFAGVALVALGSGGDLSANLKGDGLAVLGSATWAAYSVAIAPLMRRYSPFRLSAVFLLAVTVPLALAGSAQLRDQSFDFGALVWIGFAFAVIGPLIVTNLLWFTAIDRVGPSRASLFANLQPFLAAIFALLLLSEHITSVQVAGGLAIAGGIVLASSRRGVPQPPAE